MKTFYEWLELNEAGFFGNLFGKTAQPVQQPQINQSPEDKEKERQKRAHDETMALLVPGYKSGPQSEPARTVLKPGVAAAHPVEQPTVPREKGSGGSLFDQLCDLVGDRISNINRIKLRTDRSLRLEPNRSDLYEAYTRISSAKHYGSKDDVKGMSDSDVDRALSLMERMFKEELGMTAFPDEDTIVPYGKYGPDEYKIMDAMITHLEEPALVVAKGFRGARTIPARVSVDLYRRKFGGKE